MGNYLQVTALLIFEYILHLTPRGPPPWLSTYFAYMLGLKVLVRLFVERRQDQPATGVASGCVVRLNILAFLFVALSHYTDKKSKLPIIIVLIHAWPLLNKIQKEMQLPRLTLSILPSPPPSPLLIRTSQ